MGTEVAMAAVSACAGRHSSPLPPCAPTLSMTALTRPPCHSARAHPAPAARHAEISVYLLCDAHRTVALFLCVSHVAATTLFCEHVSVNCVLLSVCSCPLWVRFSCRRLHASRLQPAPRRKVIDSIHDFQRQGGLTRQFEQLDRLVSSYLIPPLSDADGLSEGVQVGGSLHSQGPEPGNIEVQEDEQ
jgi:hypothetical protein